MTSMMAETVEKKWNGVKKNGEQTVQKGKKKLRNVWGSGLKKQVESKSGGKNAECYFSRQNKALAFPAVVVICVTEVTRGAEKV